MKKLSVKNGIFFALLLLVGTFVSCLSDGDETIVLEKSPSLEGSKTFVVSSSESAVLEQYGFRLNVPRGAVPSTSSGGDGRVAFSIQPTDELPAQLPSGYEAIEGTNVKIEPMNFTFNTPLSLDIPLQGYNAKDVVLFRFNDASNAWEIVPFSDVSDDNVSISTIDFGQYSLSRKTDISDNLGGVHVSGRYLQEGYFYYLTLTPSSGNRNSVKKISFAANGSDIYMANIPLGSYTVTIVRENRRSASSSSSEIEYGSGLTVNVRTSLVTGTDGFASYSGWTEINLNNVYWSSGRPDDVWGDATVTYGTGRFQATLTWVNSSGSIVDYDLHLVGPDFHVYFSDKHSPNFELDRDWISDLGNAIENIYSINDDFVPGVYTVNVHHYSGVLNKRYNCRVIVDGVVVKSHSGAISTENATDEIYSFTIN